MHNKQAVLMPQPNLKNVFARAKCCKGQGAGRLQQGQGIMRLKRPSHLACQPEGHQFWDGQHLDSSTKGVPAFVSRQKSVCDARWHMHEEEEECDTLGCSAKGVPALYQVSCVLQDGTCMKKRRNTICLGHQRHTCIEHYIMCQGNLRCKTANALRRGRMYHASTNQQG